MIPATQQESAPIQSVGAAGFPWRLMTPAEVLPHVQDAHARGDLITLDTETTGLDPWRSRLITVQVRAASGAVAVLDVRHATTSDLAQLAEAAHLLVSGQVELLGHNLKFDLSHLCVSLGIPPRDLRRLRVWDTMLAEQVLLGGIADEDGARSRASLDATAARYGFTILKEARSWFAELDERPAEWNAPIPMEQLEYAARDLVHLPAIRAAQRERLATQGVAGQADLHNGVA